MSLSSLVALASLGLNVIILFSTISGFIKLAKNDIHHQGVAIKNLSEKMDTVLQRLSTIEGRCLYHAERKKKSKK